MTPWIVTAGLGQLALCLASLAIPRILEWKQDLAKLRPLNRQAFRVYAGYTFGIHIAFSLVSTLAPHWLLTGTPLATAVTGTISLYWGVRLILQFVYFDRSDAPAGRRFEIAEVLLVVLFASLSIVYFLAMMVNFRIG